MLFWFFWHLADLDKAGIKSTFWALLLAQTSAEIFNGNQCKIRAEPGGIKDSRGSLG